MKMFSDRMPGRAVAAAGLLWLALASPAAIAAAQPRFATPEAAVAAVRAAFAAGKPDGVAAIFGEENRDLVVTGDPATDADAYAEALRKMELFTMLDPVAEDRREILVGEQAWPFPIPLVKEAGGWRFASEEGREEILNRRVGENELYAISVMQAYLDAQTLYASEDRNGDGVREYAQKLNSSPGMRDGLYWTADPAKGEALSPWGPLIASTSIVPEQGKASQGYRGYRYRVLTRQGPAAAGGTIDYVINGRMLAGYALVAYPVDYDDSGIMTFMINRNGRIFQRDLGPDTARIAVAMQEFDPGPGWVAVDK